MPPRKRETDNLPDASDLATTIAKLATDAGKSLATLPMLLGELMKVPAKSLRGANQLSLFEAPKCVLNERISSSRRFAAQSYPMSRLRRLAKAYDATVNDAVLAACSGALRGYLIGINALPDQPLTAMVPLSLRRDDSVGGNKVAVILANLATHLADPAERMRVIKASVGEGKQRYESMTYEESLGFAALLLAPTMLNAMTGIAPRVFNVVISNVPGPKTPLYWNGARLQRMYPLSIVLDNLALNITLTSYVDSLEFGIVGCRRTLPSIQKLIEHLDRSILQLEEAAGLSSEA
jgi:diacylglycerol O-acyltransferase